jgi:hypothetical protein
MVQHTYFGISRLLGFAGDPTTQRSLSIHVVEDIIIGQRMKLMGLAQICQTLSSA